MNIFIEEDNRTLINLTIEKFIKSLEDFQDPNILLTCEESLIPVYQQLVKVIREKRIDLTQANFFLSHEYLSVDVKSVHSRFALIEKVFLSPLKIDKKNIYKFNTQIDPIDSLENYKESLNELRGIDIAFVTFSSRGHLLANDIASSPSKIVDLNYLPLQEQKILNKKFPKLSRVPKGVLTVGIGEILNAEKIIVFNSGLEYSNAIIHILEKPIHSNHTASFLQLHQDVDFFLDKQVAGALEHYDYYLSSRKFFSIVQETLKKGNSKNKIVKKQIEIKNQNRTMEKPVVIQEDKKGKSKIVKKRIVKKDADKES